MRKLGARNYALIVQGVKGLGTYDPKQIFCFFEEQLYLGESEEIFDFLAWVNEFPEMRSFGHGNYEERFKEFKLCTRTKKKPAA